MDLPQETMLWYVVPAIRRALVMELKGWGLLQKDIAPVLGVTEAAISQYVKDKRATAGSKIASREPLLSEIRKSAKAIFNDKKEATAIREINRLCAFVRDSKIICEFHRIHHPDQKCTICYD